MAGPQKRPTIRDVAALAGVSQSTVSHAFSGRRRIRQETRERIFHAAEELGYYPDPLAKSMRTRRSGIVGFALRPKIDAGITLTSLETFNRLSGAISLECIRAGLGSVHVPTMDENLLAEFPMDGCIVAHPRVKDPIIDSLISRGMPVVCADPDPSRPNACALASVNYKGGMRTVLDFIKVAKGDEVWLLVDSERNAWSIAAEEVFADWAEEIGLRPTVRRDPGYLRAGDVRGAIEELLACQAPPRAVVFSRSDLSEAVVMALNKLGLRIPQDVQLATFTDSMHTRIPPVSVTALDLNHENLAEAAVHQMLELLKTPGRVPKPIRVEALPIERASTRVGIRS